MLDEEDKLKPHCICVNKPIEIEIRLKSFEEDFCGQAGKTEHPLSCRTGCHQEIGKVRKTR